MTTTTQTTTTVRTRLGALHVRMLGEGPTIVCWPSMFVDGHTFDDLAAVLALDHRVVIVDGPGLGLSESLTRVSSIDEAAAAAAELLAAIGGGPVDWLGNAFGGHVGLKLARREGLLRSLVAVSSPVEPISPELRRKIKLLLPLVNLFGARGPIPGVVREAMLTEASAADPRIRAVLDASLARPTRRSLALAIRSFILERKDVTAELADIRVPSLFVASDDRGDWAPEDAAASAALTPRARAVTVHAARTLVPLEQPQALHAHLRAFWAELEH